MSISIVQECIENAVDRLPKQLSRCQVMNSREMLLQRAKQRSVAAYATRT